MENQLKRLWRYVKSTILWLPWSAIIIILIMLGRTVPWTGFGDYTTSAGELVPGKTLWDWMELLIIPIVLAIGAYYLNRSERAVERRIAEDRAKLEREIATDRQQEATLQAYIDRISELLLEKKLRTTADAEVRDVARTRTLSVMKVLDTRRNNLVLQFLREAKLITDANSILNRARMAQMDLSKLDLSGLYLQNADLETAKLEFASLQDANLRGADLRHANLQGANLQAANLDGAILDGAILGSADLRNANLLGTIFLKANLDGANLYDANLRGVDLRGVHLQGTKLQKANLQGVNLQEANLQGAVLWEANLQDADWGMRTCGMRACKVQTCGV